MPSQSLGRVRPVMRGEWAAGTAYVALDIVSHNGSSYIARVDSVGLVPADNANAWDLLASKGDTGAVGADGEQGIPGAAGAVGAQGPQGRFLVHLYTAKTAAGIALGPPPKPDGFWFLDGEVPQPRRDGEDTNYVHWGASWLATTEAPLGVWTVFAYANPADLEAALIWTDPILIDTDKGFSVIILQNNA